MKQKIQIILILAMVVAGIRLAWILYERHEAGKTPEKTEAPPLNPDYYVTPKKLYPYDLKSAKQLTKQPAWVKVGYAYSFYLYNPAARRADLSHEVGKLSPLQRLEIHDVAIGVSPQDPGERQVLAVFHQEGKDYAAPIGTEKSGEYKFYSDDMLFIEDPHQLYKHWPADIWKAIDQHEVKPGMSELQADFAIGVGLLQPGGDPTGRTLNYANGGKPITISYRNGKAVEIRPGTSS
jgi:hypothetical protein